MCLYPVKPALLPRCKPGEYYDGVEKKCVKPALLPGCKPGEYYDGVEKKV
ncbi:hypothetical protein RRG08_049242, partial [Elysia crispata]